MGHAISGIMQYWWLIFVFGGSIAGGLKALSAANERRAERRQERYRIKQQTKAAIAATKADERRDARAVRRELDGSLDEHTRTDMRWFSYESDVATLLDYPMMIDMREELTVAFHREKRVADLLRPEDPDSMTEPASVREYRDAVHAYAVAFDVAEAEAKRRRRGDFSAIEQERLSRAQHLLSLAMDDGATSEERRSAYARARKELDGLIAVPTAAASAVERAIAGELGSSVDGSGDAGSPTA